MRTETERWFLVALVGALAVTGCEALESLDPDSHDPRDLSGQYAWILEGWDEGRPEGYPSVGLTWGMPYRSGREVFRVYSRRASSGTYGLIATVTSCADGICRYSDTNVVPGRSYDYYVATVDERDGVEVGTTRAIRVAVPSLPSLGRPGAPVAVSLDDAVFLRWTTVQGASRYAVVVLLEDGSTFLIGETDGASYLDDRAENGQRYEYFVAAVDGDGHVSSLSERAVAVPRPDAEAAMIHAHADSPARSGFRFVESAGGDPIRSGNAADAQWRLEVVDGRARIRPLGSTAITSGVFTTRLSCGPASEEDCIDIRVAPPAAEFGTEPVVARAAYTYVLRVVDGTGDTHYGKIRVLGTGEDEAGRRFMIFDWAYQLRAEEPRLDRRN